MMACGHEPYRKIHERDCISPFFIKIMFDSFDEYFKVRYGSYKKPTFCFLVYILDDSDDDWDDTWN